MLAPRLIHKVDRKSPDVPSSPRKEFNFIVYAIQSSGPLTKVMMYRHPCLDPSHSRHVGEGRARVTKLHLGETKMIESRFVTLDAMVSRRPHLVFGSHILEKDL